jgi:hypothetical protein
VRPDPETSRGARGEVTAFLPRSKPPGGPANRKADSVQVPKIIRKPVEQVGNLAMAAFGVAVLALIVALIAIGGKAR